MKWQKFHIGRNCWRQLPTSLLMKDIQQTINIKRGTPAMSADMTESTTIRIPGTSDTMRTVHGGALLLPRKGDVDALL